MSIDFLPLFIPCGMSFSSDWYYHNVDTKFSEEIMMDPLKRLDMEEKQGRFIREKYPTFFGHKGEYKAHPSIGIGVATVPKCWGCQVKFLDHMNPVALPLVKPEQDPSILKEPNLKDTAQWLLEEIDVFIEHGFDKRAIGLPDLQGPLNVATKLVGDDRMLGLIARKNKADLVHEILEKTSNTYIEIYQLLREATGKPKKGDFSVSGCTHYYLSPSQWTKFILPIVKKCEALGDRIRLHHCGLATTEKIETYAQYPFKSVEFGFGSDLKRARDLFIHPKLGPVDISCRVSPYRMLNQPAEQIKADIKWIIENAKGGPMSINCVGVPWQTPEANLWALWNSVEEYNKSKEDEDED